MTLFQGGVEVAAGGEFDVNGNLDVQTDSAVHGGTLDVLWRTYVTFGATFTQTGGQSTMDHLYVYGNSFYDLSGGTLTVKNSLNVTDGVMQQSGGTLIAETVDVSSSGRYDLAGGQLEISDRLDMTTTLDFVNGNATVILGNDAIADFSSGTVLNAGNATYTAAVQSESYFPTGFNPYAEFGSFSSQGLVHTQGTMLVIPVNYSGHVFRLNANSLEIAGTIILDPGGQITTSSFDLAGGTLMGEGTVIADMFRNDGTVSPGQSPGMLNIDAPYTQGAGGRFLVELGGLIAEDEYDVLVIEDVASLAGILEVVIIDGFAPELGDHFDIMQAESFSGGFDTTIFPAHYDFALSLVNSDTTLRLTGIVVPDPATMGDTNGDGIIDELDLGNLVAQLGGLPGVESADFNGDNFVDLEDFALLRENFGFGVVSAPNAEFGATTPEPGTLGMLALGGLALLSRRRKQ